MPATSFDYTFPDLRKRAHRSDAGIALLLPPWLLLTADYKIPRSIGHREKQCGDPALPCTGLPRCARN